MNAKMPDYTGKKIVIIGGTSGMGLETAAHFAAGGARVLVTGRSEAGQDAARAALGDAAVVVQSDVTSTAHLDQLAETVRTELGSVDLLFISAGIAGGAPLAETSEETYDEIMATNARGPYFAVQRLVPLIHAGGSIVVTTSAANVKALPNSAVYGAAKAALRSLVRSLAAELLPLGIRVNAVRPGAIATGILGRAFGADAAAEMEARFAEANPMGRMGTSAEITQTVAYLAFDATFTTGAELPVDGGATQL